MSNSQERMLSQFQVGQPPYIPRDKVVAAPWQAALLQQLLRRAGDSPPKEEIVRTSKETGLEVRWIRNWLSRQRRGRAKSVLGDTATSSKEEGESCTTSTPASTTPSADISGSSRASSGANMSIHQLPQTQPERGRQRKRKRQQRQPDTGVQSQNIVAEPPVLSGHYVQIARPGTSFSIPLHPTPQTQSKGPSSLVSVDPESLQVDNGLKTGSLTRSPSLGYIPLAFPMTFMQPPGAVDFEPSLTGDTSLGSDSTGNTSDSAIQPAQIALGTQVSCPTMYAEDFMPTVPTLPLDYTQLDPPESQHSSNMLYLSQLLLDASNALVPQPTTDALGDSQYLSEPLPLSFAPSLQSHSTSVLGTVSTNPTTQYGQYLLYPPPVAFKARVTDLAMLTKRIRATYEYSMGGGRAEGHDVEDRSAATSLSEADVSRGSASSASQDSAQDASIAVTTEEDDSDEEELMTPAGDLPSFIDDLSESQGSSESKNKGRQVAYEDGVLAEVA